MENSAVKISVAQKSIADKLNFFSTSFDGHLLSVTLKNCTQNSQKRIYENSTQFGFITFFSNLYNILEVTVIFCFEVIGDNSVHNIIFLVDIHLQ